MNKNLFVFRFRFRLPQNSAFFWSSASAFRLPLFLFYSAFFRFRLPLLKIQNSPALLHINIYSYKQTKTISNK
uniref:Uncharacterized protein n=1 Tax=Meloidogyne enterolobii TaxID=390850 RepID=A0A6V7X8G1_MELEN|nr:unnamed protein product [Meloidogyne enterolobii]